MRKKFKTILKLFALGTIFVLGGCEAEKDLITETKNSNPIKEYTFKQISQQPKFNKAYHKFTDGLNNMRMANRVADSDFEIDSTTVKEVTIGDKTTYTMAIKRPTPDSSYFENLIIQSKAGDSTKAYIAKFTPNQVINQNETQHSLGFKGTVQVKEIAFDSSSFSNRLSLQCLTIKWCNIGDSIHEAYSPACNCIATTTVCYEYGTDQGPTYNYGSGGSNYYGGNNGGGSNGGIAITPVVPCTKNCPDLSTDPCITLAPLMQEPVVTTAIDFLKPKTQGKNEFGYGVTHGWDPTGTNIVFNTEFQTGNNSSVAAIKTGGKIAGGIHNHPLEGGAIPSIGDVDWLMHCEQDNYSMNDGTAFTMVVVANPQLQGATITYAVTINDLGALQAQMAADFALPEVQDITLMENKIKYLLALQAVEFRNAITSAALEKKFLEYFSNYGINLSKFDPATNKWNNLKLQNRYNPSFPNAANTVLSEPCN